MIVRVMTHSQRQPSEVSDVHIALMQCWRQYCRKAVQVPLHSPLKRGPEKSHATQRQQSNALNYVIAEESFIVTLSDDYIRHIRRSREASRRPPSMKLESCSKGLHLVNCFTKARIRTGHSLACTISRKTKLNKWQHPRWQLGICPSEWTAFSSM